MEHTERNYNDMTATESSYRNVIHAMFQNRDTAARAAAALMDQGVQGSDISVMLKEMPGDTNLEGSNEIMSHAETGITVTTPEDALAGATKGAGIGLGLGVLASIAALTLPGVGLVLGGGALAAGVGATLATGAAGAVSGAAYGYLKDQGVTEDQAKQIEDDVRKGGALVSVISPSGEVSTETVEQILSKYQDQWYPVGGGRMAPSENYERVDGSVGATPPTTTNPKSVRENLFP